MGFYVFEYYVHLYFNEHIKIFFIFFKLYINNKLIINLNSGKKKISFVNQFEINKKFNYRNKNFDKYKKKLYQ